MLGTAGHLRSTNCSVNGVRATAFIDTGAEVSAGNQALFNALAEDNPLLLQEGNRCR